MAFSIDPQTFIGNAISGVVNSPIIVGLPSTIAPLPNFILATIPGESAHGSVSWPALQITAGQLLMKSAINSGQYKITVVLSDQAQIPTIWYTLVATALQQFSQVANSIANYGSVLPNPSGLTSNFVASQLSTLFAIKNGMQPVMIMNSYILLGSISQSNANLKSDWYIENIDIVKEEAEGGIVLQVSLKELLSKGNTLQTAKQIANVAGETLSPIAGTLLQGVLNTSGAALL